MNNIILLVEENPDDQFLIKRALHPRFLNQTNLVGTWKKPVEQRGNCNAASTNSAELSYISTPPINHSNKLDVSVEIVEDKKQAAQYLKGKRKYANRERYPLPILILISVAMPHLVGLSLLAWIKRQPELIQIPIVILSDVDKKDQAFSLGASAYIFKTLCFTELTTAVRTILIADNKRTKEESLPSTERFKTLQTLENSAIKSSRREQSRMGDASRNPSWAKMRKKQRSFNLKTRPIPPY
jgi:CheY-like chemotaxis protein